MKSSSSPLPENTKWQALCNIYQLPLNTVQASLSKLAKKLNLPAESAVWDQIQIAFINRERNNDKANAAIEKMASLNDSVALKDLIAGMRSLQDKLIAMFAAQDFPAGTYHFYGHGKEMANDPGMFIENFLPKDNVARY